MPQLDINHSDGTTETIDKTHGYLHKRELGQMEKLTVRINRNDGQVVTLTKKVDEIDLAGVTTTRLFDINKRGSAWELVCYSFERDANRHEPTDGGVKRTQTDAAHMERFINSVSEWSVGTTTALTGDITFIFNHALAHEGMRRVEQNVPGELRWNPDKTVDYVARLGADKSASITLSPSQGNLEGDLNVKERGRSMDATHVRLIGAHEGEAQIFANLVPNGDSGNYENEVTYNQPRSSSSEDTDWHRTSNKDVASQDTIEAEAEALADELVDEHLEITARVVGEDIALGDTVHVTKPEADIDRDLRIKRLVTRAGSYTDTDSGAAVIDHVLLSSRNLARQTEQDRMRDVSRYNVAYEGSAVWGTLSSGRQPVNASLNYELPFFYPDIEFEHKAELLVRGLPYRAYSSGGAAGGDHSHVVGVTHPSHSHDVIIDAPPHAHKETQVIDRETEAASGHTHLYDDLNNGNRADLFSVSSETKTSTTELGTTQSETSDASGDHTHPPNPGVIEFATTTPTGVDVIVNGTTVATDIGSGTFETTVDVSGDLTKGAWNMIELTSDDVGHLHSVISIEAYRQLGVSP